MAHDPPDTLEPSQQKALMALLTEPTVRKAAATSGVSERSLHRWLNEDPAFSRECRRALKNMFSQGTALAQKYVSMAVQALAKIIADSKSPPSAVVAASLGLLKYSREAIETDDLAERLAAVERDVAQQKARDGAR